MGVILEFGLVLGATVWQLIVTTVSLPVRLVMRNRTK